jgi:formylglycine-generating enzyme required for sulfatase activity
MTDASDFIDYSQRASIGLVQRVPSGHVRLGSRFHPREEPPHTMNVREFEMAHIPVTVNQYAIFLLSGGIDEKRWWSAEGWAWRQGDIDGWGREDRAKPDDWNRQKNRHHHPITGVTWYEAEAYCNWLGYAKKQRVRLPTEEEWERAARGDDTRPFPWGEEFDPALANTLESERGITVEAGSLAGDVSLFGIHDLAGNVQEWTSSTYDPLPEENFLSVKLYAVRGGSYYDTAYAARTSFRRAYPAGYFYPFLGFRVVVGLR